MAHILVLADARLAKNCAAIVLRSQRHSIRQATTTQDAKRLYEEEHLDLAIIDVGLASGGATHFAIQLFKAQPEIRLIFLSALRREFLPKNDAENIARITKLSYVILAKPLTPKILADTIEELLSTVGQAVISRTGKWLHLINEHLKAVLLWLEKDDDDIQSWNLATATAHGCVEEMKAAVATGRYLYLDPIVAQLEGVVDALKLRDRAEAQQLVRKLLEKIAKYLT